MDPVEQHRELQADALDRRPDEVGPGVFAAQPEIGAGERGVPQRRAFREEVRQHDQAVAARWDAGGEVEHGDIAGSPEPSRGRVRSGTSAEPAQRTTIPPLLTAPPTTQVSSVSA